MKLLTLPNWITSLLLEFALVIRQKSTWHKVEIILVGAILATGKRTMSAVLRVMGLSQSPKFAYPPINR